MKNLVFYFFATISFILIISCTAEEDLIPISSVEHKVEVRENGCEGCSVEIGFLPNFDCVLQVFLDEGCGEVESYEWSYPNISATVFHSTISAGGADGVYCVTVTFKNGCVETDCINLTDCIEDCDNNCIRVGHAENRDCQVRVFFEECESFATDITWNAPNYTVPVSSTFLTSEINGTYCATVTFENGCKYTDCFEVDGCEEVNCDDIMDAISFDITQGPVSTCIVEVCYENLPMDITLYFGTDCGSSFIPGPNNNAGVISIPAGDAGCMTISGNFCNDTTYGIYDASGNLFCEDLFTVVCD